MITDTTKILTVNADGIPGFLKAQPWWINWKPVFLDGKAKKLPTLGECVLRGQYWENAGRPFAEALRTVPEHGGVSLLLSLQNELACIDIDNCDASDARLQKIKQLAPDAWCELSPSGHGVHVWGRLPDKCSYLLPGRKTIGYCGREYEWYASGRGITVTGRAVGGEARENISAAALSAATDSGGCKGLADLTAAVKFCESLRPKIAETAEMAAPFSAARGAGNALSATHPAGTPASFLFAHGADGTANTASVTCPAAMSVDSILQKAFAKDPELQRMYYCGHSWDDKSREDFSFCRRLWFWLGGHGARAIENVFEHSALYRRSKGPGYISLTIRNAAKRWNGNYYGKGWAG